MSTRRLRTHTRSSSCVATVRRCGRCYPACLSCSFRPRSICSLQPSERASRVRLAAFRQRARLTRVRLSSMRVAAATTVACVCASAEPAHPTPTQRALERVEIAGPLRVCYTPRRSFGIAPWWASRRGSTFFCLFFVSFAGRVDLARRLTSSPSTECHSSRKKN
jgi:hypothetical protein